MPEFLIVVESQQNSPTWRITNPPDSKVIECRDIPHDLLEEIVHQELAPGAMTVNHRGNPLTWWKMTVYRGRAEDPENKCLEFTWGYKRP